MMKIFCLQITHFKSKQNKNNETERVCFERIKVERVYFYRMELCGSFKMLQFLPRLTPV